ncbi:MAG: glucosidase, partial [Chloroflexi bacterium]|nr:glucosidase [Chloroflexota bacterium]
MRNGLTRRARPDDRPPVTAEAARLEQARTGVPWRRWGPYLAERTWGTVREDYSADGDAWGSFGHDQSRLRAYRWTEDGLLGICDDEQRLCLALCLWNERDPILKERLFGLGNPQGNHGEDVKELYFYEDALPSSALLRATYLYPQAAFPYDDLVAENGRRRPLEPELELIDTGVLDGDRFFEVEVAYAKTGPDAIVMRVRATNRGPDEAVLHLLPTAWFRNTWAWSDPAGPMPVLALAGDTAVAEHQSLGRYRLAAVATGATVEWLFTDNETNASAVFGSTASSRSRFTKDAFHRYLVGGDAEAVSPA